MGFPFDADTDIGFEAGGGIAVAPFWLDEDETLEMSEEVFADGAGCGTKCNFAPCEGKPAKRTVKFKSKSCFWYLKKAQFSD